MKRPRRFGFSARVLVVLKPRLLRACRTANTRRLRGATEPRTLTSSSVATDSGRALSFTAALTFSVVRLEIDPASPLPPPKRTRTKRGPRGRTTVS